MRERKFLPKRLIPQDDREQMDKPMSDLAVVETILRNRFHFFAEIRDGVELPQKLRSMFVSSVIFFALYGAVLGSSSTLWQTLSSAIKLPVLFLATLLICAPTLYFFNVLFGSNQSLMQNVALIMTAITVTSVLLLSLAPITLFFLLSTGSQSYQFFKLLNVACCAISGFMGVRFLRQGMQIVSVSGDDGENMRRWILRGWMFIYAFVGSQLAWTIRPFVGAPNMEFEMFRQLGGNFYANIFASLGEILGFFIVK